MALHGNVPVIPTPFLNGKVHLSDFDNLIDKTAEHFRGLRCLRKYGRSPGFIERGKNILCRLLFKENTEREADRCRTRRYKFKSSCGNRLARGGCWSADGINTKSVLFPKFP